MLFQRWRLFAIAVFIILKKTEQQLQFKAFLYK